MTEPTDRTPGAYGRRTPKDAPAIRAERILTGVTPTHPAAQDNLKPLTGWEILGNDAAGDCVSVTWANFRRLVTALLGGAENYPDQAQVWQVYRTQNPDFDPNGTASTNGPGSDADRGMDIQTLLEYLVKTGGPDGVKAVAFAKVNPARLEDVKAALSIFGGLWVGIDVQAANERQFAKRQPWDYVPGSPNEGGHSVLAGGYLGPSTGAEGGGPVPLLDWIRGASGQPTGDVTFVTWGAETTFTDRYWTSGLVGEVWAVIWPEHLGTKAFQDGVDLTALSADYKALTGRDLPIPTPPVNPPQPPAPDPADVTLAAAVGPWAAKGRTGSLAPIAAAINTWRKQVGV